MSPAHHLFAVEEDSDPNNTLQAYFDKETNFSFDRASQGEEAVEAVRQATALSAPYAVAFIDIRMPPGIDGLQTATQIREIDPNIQIFIITAFSDYSVEQIQHQLSHHVVVLNKPFYPSDLLQFTANAIHAWERTQEIERLKLKLSQSLPMEHQLSWEANLLNDQFTPSKALEKELAKLNAPKLSSFSDFLIRFHPVEWATMNRLIQSGDEFFTLLHRFSDGSNDFQWMMTQGRVVLWQEDKAAEIYGFTTPISTANRLQASFEPHTELLTLQRLSRANRVAGISGVVDFQKQCQNLSASKQPFTLLMITLSGVTLASTRSGVSTGEQLVVECIEKLTPALPSDHQIYLYTVEQLVVIQQGNASIERLSAQKEQIEAALQFTFSPQMLQIPVQAGVEIYQSQKDRLPIEKLCHQNVSGLL
ncbi:MAG: response regulator [Gammaproteobacteria bacterium]|nr:response regulator [Gammaproteobacteria bacterium]